jgi:LysM repeat protein
MVKKLMIPVLWLFLVGFQVHATDAHVDGEAVMSSASISASIADIQTGDNSAGPAPTTVSSAGIGPISVIAAVQPTDPVAIEAGAADEKTGDAVTRSTGNSGFRQNDSAVVEKAGDVAVPLLVAVEEEGDTSSPQSVVDLPFGIGNAWAVFAVQVDEKPAMMVPLSMLKTDRTAVEPNEGQTIDHTPEEALVTELLMEEGVETADEELLNDITPSGLMVINLLEDDLEVLEPEEGWMFFTRLENLLGFSLEDTSRYFDAPVSDPVLANLEGYADGPGMADGLTEVVDSAGPSPTEDADGKRLVPDIEIYTNHRVDAFIRLYTVSKRYVFEQALERSGKYLPMIYRIFREHELPLNLAYLAVVESNFNPNARSRANALGLWQFMSYTGKVFDLQRSWWHDDRYDPEKSTVAAALFLKQLHKAFNGNWELALAAYNSGGGRVRQAIRRAEREGKPTDFWSLSLPRETRGYVPAFFAVATIFNDLSGYGFGPLPEFEEEVAKKALAVPGGIALAQVASVLGLDRNRLKELNPSLRLQGLVPPVYDKFTINIPAETVIDESVGGQLVALSNNRQANWKLHQVRQGETLWSISRYYGIPLEQIRDYNHLKSKNLIRIGQKLMLPIPADWGPPSRQDTTKIAMAAAEKLPGITYIHIVKKGESLWKISNQYNVTIDEIRQWNRQLLNQKYLKIGMELVLKLPADNGSQT